jgi:hypothetical protein
MFRRTAVKLGAPIRGAIYGLALILGVPLAASAGKTVIAVVIAVVTLCCIGLETAMGRRKDRGR